MNNTVIITGCRGMDGSILSEKYLQKGYRVVGIDRWEPTESYPNLSIAMENPNFIFETGDICEKRFMYEMIKKYEPELIYNMAAISLVPESFKIPEKIFEINTIAVLNMLEILREFYPTIKFYQASTSEMIGKNTMFPQNLDSKMIPNSPYAIAKLASHHLIRLYREAYGLFACSCMLHNHEGTRRGATFVTRKITKAVANIKKNGVTVPLELGNIDTFRDWGNADDYCEAMIRVMEADTPADYAINTGEAHSIREFVEKSFANIGVKICWKGKGIDEIGYDNATNDILVTINEKFFRPAEVEYLHGDYSKIKRCLNWKPTTHFDELIKIMIDYDLEHC